MRFGNLTTLALTATLLAAQPARGAEPASPPPGGAPAPAGTAAGSEPATRDELRALAEEIRRLKLEQGLREVDYRSYSGLGPAASKVYFAPKGLSLGGYGELVYANRLDVEGKDLSDLYRVVLYVGYRFNDRIVFNAEVEFEHAHELGIEFAYLDFLVLPALQIRAGSVLVPVGIVNEMHEPTFFNGVFRPQVERNLIPSTWNDNGIGLHGEAGGLSYKAYLLTGLNAFGAETLQASSWLRRARTGGGESPAESLAGVAALQYAAGPITLGGSIYRGRADQGKKATATGEAIEATVTLGELHALAQWRGFSARGLWAVGRLGAADQVSTELGLAGNAMIGSGVQGGYLELAWDAFSAIDPGAATSFTPFVRLERLNLHDRIPAGGLRDPALDQRFVTTGFTWKPIPTVAVKADYARKTTEAGGKAEEAVNLGIGFVY